MLFDLFGKFRQVVTRMVFGRSYRFYFTQAYNASEKTFDEPSYQASSIGKVGKGKGKGKGKRSENSETKKFIDKPIVYNKVDKPLRTLDLFAGCGGKYKLKSFYI